ncbi:MAG: Type secretory pathway, component PulD, partial [Chthonomonadales bacterium]|nr:Type secretory pathway, component PulD [Chthonomonadales bacterium]
MRSNDNNLLVAYKRRALLTRGLATVVTASMALTPLASLGQAPAQQDPPKPTVQTPPPAGAGQTGTPPTGVKPDRGAPTGGTQADPGAKQDPTTIIPRQRRGNGGTGGGPFTFTPDGQTRQGRPGGFSGFPGGGTPFSFDFKGSNIADVLKLFAMMSGQTITADSTLSGQVTIINPKQVTLDDAFKILQSVLAARGFTAQTQPGGVISIVPFKAGVATATKVSTDPTAPLDPRNQIMTQIIPLDNVEADALAKDLQGLISPGASLVGSNSSNALILTDTASNIQRFLTIVESLDKSSNNNEMVIYPLRRAEAASVASVITNIYSQTSVKNTGTARGGQPQQQIPGQPPGQGPATAAARPTVVAVADGRTNSVIVIASRDKQTEIAKKLIAMLDDDDTNTLDTKLVK